MIPTCTLHTSTCKVQRHGNNLKNTTLAKDLKCFSNDSIHSFPATYAFSYDLFGKLGSLYEGLNLFVQSMHMFNCDETSNSIVQEPGKFKGGGWVRVVQCLFSDICQQLHTHLHLSFRVCSPTDDAYPERSVSLGAWERNCSPVHFFPPVAVFGCTCSGFTSFWKTPLLFDP